MIAYRVYVIEFAIYLNGKFPSEREALLAAERTHHNCRVDKTTVRGGMKPTSFFYPSEGRTVRL